MIQLAAGEHKANLSEVLPEMEARIRNLECNLLNELNTQAAAPGQAGADLLLKMYVAFPDTSEPDPQAR